MFRMLSSSFEDDPFFADSFLAHRESMRNMMRSFSEPLGRDLLSISDGRRRTHNRRDHDDGEDSLTHADVNPFQAVDRMMVNMRNGIQELQRNFGQLSMDPNGHSFCSSSVMTYSKVGDEPPKVFQASTQTRRVPGGVKETRKAMRDSDSGLERMAVGHHIHDRGHVIRKSKNSKTGDEEVNQEFINMNESDGHAFDDEWQNEVLKYKPIGRSGNTGMGSVGHEHSGSQELKRSTFSKLDRIISHKSGLNRYKKIEIIPCILSYHHRLRLLLKNNINNRKPTYMWKLNNTVFNDNLVKEEIKKFKIF